MSPHVERVPARGSVAYAAAFICYLDGNRSLVDTSWVPTGKLYRPPRVWYRALRFLRVWDLQGNETKRGGTSYREWRLSLDEAEPVVNLSCGRGLRI